jgi:hypothetical protein
VKTAAKAKRVRPRLVANLSGNSPSFGAAVSYAGTDTSSPFGTTAVATGSSGDPSVSLTTNNDNSIIEDNVFYDCVSKEVLVKVIAQKQQ